MNLVVTMKQIPDLQQIRISNRKPVLESVPLTLGNIDKNALEAAVVIRDNLGEGTVTVLSAGNEEIEDTVKEALAAGADEAFLVADEDLEGACSSVIAQILAAAVKEIKDMKLIFFGEGSGDNYSGQVGSRVAELLGLPQVGFASAIEIKGNTAIVTRSLEDCEEIVEVSLPAVITVLPSINEPRIPSVTQILKAGKKPKKVFEVRDLDFHMQTGITTVTVSNLAPESNRKRIAVNSAQELLEALKSENLVGR